MLTSIREKATGWIAGVIVGALIISFAFWGVSFYFGQGGDVNVAIVNGEEIKLQSYQRAFFNLRKQMQQVFGDSLSSEEEELIKQQTIQRLVDTELVDQLVQDNGFRISDTRVVQTIKELDFFKGDDGFDRSKYERSIISLGMDPVFFEAQLRNDLLSEQLQAGLSDSLFVTESELNNVISLKLQTRTFDYVILEIDNYVDAIEVSDGEIEDFYNKNPQIYNDPEKVKVAYIELDVEMMADDVAATEEQLREYYQDNKEQYDVVEQRSVTKLVTKIDEESTDEDKEQAQEAINKALTLVQEGKSFEDIIEKFNEDGKGLLEFSEHPYMAKGVMQKEVDEFLFGSDEGEISDIIETKKGFNIVKVGEIRGGPKNIYENSAEDVAKDYKKYQAELQFFELSDQLTTLAYEHPDSLELAAEEIDMTIEETGYFSRESENEGVLKEAKFIEAAFNPELISSGENSDAIEISDNHIVVLRVLDHKTATTKPLEDVREEVIADVKTDKAIAKVKEIGETIITKYKSGLSIEDISAELGIEWELAENVSRDDISVSRAVLRTAFQVAKPENGESEISGQRLGSGDYAVVVVNSSGEGELASNEDDSDEESENIKNVTINDLKRTRGTNEWKQFMHNLRKNSNISVFEDNI